jgi:hypothetical protein
MHNFFSRAAHAAGSSLHLIGGIAFIVVWLALCIGWGIMSMSANLMANDSGSASPEKHMALIYRMLAGQILALLAVIPGGLAFFWAAHRATCIWTFAGMVGIGVAIQAWAFKSFFCSK